MQKNKLILKLAGAGLIAWCVGNAQAAQIAVANVRAGGQTLTEAYVWAGAPADTGLVERSYAGSTAAGESSQTLFTGQAFASSNAGTLKASAQISVDNPLLSAGVPGWFTATGNATLQENLLVGNAAVSSVRFKLHIDGTLATASQSSFQRELAQGAFINLRQDNVDIYARSKYEGTSFDDEVWTRPIAISGGAGYLNIYLQAYVTILTSNNGGVEGGYLSAQSLFNNTASFVEAYGFDSTGRQVSLNGLTGSGGFSYQEAPISNVPEPRAWALMLGGLLGLIGVRRLRAARR